MNSIASASITPTPSIPSRLHSCRNDSNINISERRAFGSLATRFKSTKLSEYNTIGPGYYYNFKNFEPKSPSFSCLGYTGLISKSRRFPRIKRDIIIDPNNNEMNSNNNDNNNDNYNGYDYTNFTSNTKKYITFTQDKRFKNNSHHILVPGPGYYNHNTNNNYGYNYNNISSVFKSKSKRFNDIKSNNNNDDINDASNNTNIININTIERISFENENQYVNTKNKRKINVKLPGFLVSSKRFDIKNNDNNDSILNLYETIKGKNIELNKKLYIKKH